MVKLVGRLDLLDLLFSQRHAESRNVPIDMLKLSRSNNEEDIRRFLNDVRESNMEKVRPFAIATFSNAAETSLSWG